jgi:hypothetical protein
MEMMYILPKFLANAYAIIVKVIPSKDAKK